MSGPTRKIKFLKGSVGLHLIFIAVLGLLAYSNTFEAPFHFDDEIMVVENPTVKSFQYFIHPSKAEGFQHYHGFISRFVGYLSFALNYRLHGLDVTGYHITNLAIHIANAFLVYLIVLLTFRTPRIKDSALAERAKHIALFSALLFVSHPVQTQAVTYIVQRFASLATMFYLGSLVFYVKWRLGTEQQSSSAAEKKRHSRESGNPGTSMRKTRKTLDSRLRGNDKIGAFLLYCSAVLFAVLAMKTKETAFTLPLVVALYEFMFFKGESKRRMLHLIPLLVTMLIIPLSFISLAAPAGDIIKDVADMTRVQDISRYDYLLTQFRVIVTYIRLLFIPINQNLDYDYPVFHSFLSPQVFLSFLFLISIFGLGVYMLMRSRTEAAGRLIAFGIFWFFLALSVESTLIPLQVIFEHRVYLPSAGAFWALGTGAFILIGRLKHKGARAFAASSLVLIPLVLSYAAYERNSVWKTELGLWEDVVRKSPNKARGHNNLGNAYEAEGNIDKALEHFRIALKLDPDNAVIHNNLGNTYKDKGLIDKAIQQYQTALRLKPDYVKAHNNIGTAYRAKGMTDKAMEHLRIALKLKPGNAEIHYNLGNAYRSEGLTERAIEHYGGALRLKPDYAAAHNNIAAAYLSKGMVEKAVEHYGLSIRLNPGYAKAHYNLGLIHLKKGDMDAARKEFQAVLRIDPGYSEARRYLERIGNY